MTYQSENELEEQLISQLVSMGYEKVKINDEEASKSNFRSSGNKWFLHDA